jgi:threonine dehydratase
VPPEKALTTAPAAPGVVTLADVQAARKRIQPYVHKTSLRPSVQLSKLTGSNVWLKFENQQRTGSFKIRGAMNKILTLGPDERARGVVAASAGNHAQGVALAASTLGVKATVVMPAGATLQKVEATRNYGAEIVLHGANYDEAYQKALEIQKDRNLVFVHAYNDDAVMAGQGTIALEILEDLPDVDVVVTGVGGGGLAAGLATALKGLKPDVKVYGVQPELSAYLPQSLAAGHLVPAQRSDTIADGLATKKGGDKTFEVLHRLLDGVATVTEDEIAHAILLFLERQKVVVEGAGAVGLAALLSGKLRFAGQKVAVVVSGGNIDINFLDVIIKRGLVEAGRVLSFRTVLDDKPGQLRNLLDVIARAQSNVLDIRHNRARVGLPLNKTEVEIVTETKGAAHQEALMNALRAAGYDVRT